MSTYNPVHVLTTQNVRQACLPIDALPSLPAPPQSRRYRARGVVLRGRNKSGFGLADTALNRMTLTGAPTEIPPLLTAFAAGNLYHPRLTPLHLAARRGAVDACSALLRGGAAIGARTLNGSTPLHLACALLKAPAARLLLRRGADELALNSARQTPADVAGLFLSACAGKGGEKRAEDHHRGRRSRGREERFKELLGEIRDGLKGVPADRAWARRGWLVMARARLLCGRRQRAEGSDGGGGGARGDGERLVEDLADEDGGGAGNGQPHAIAATATAALVAAAVTVDGVVGDKRARHGDGTATAADEAREPGGKRFRHLYAVCPQSVDDGDGHGHGHGHGDGGALGTDGSGSPRAIISIAGFGLVARVAGIKEDGIFQNILSFL